MTWTKLLYSQRIGPFLAPIILEVPPSEFIDTPECSSITSLYYNEKPEGGIRFSKLVLRWKFKVSRSRGGKEAIKTTIVTEGTSNRLEYYRTWLPPRSNFIKSISMSTSSIISSPLRYLLIKWIEQELWLCAVEYVQPVIITTQLYSCVLLELFMNPSYK